MNTHISSSPSSRDSLQLRTCSRRVAPESSSPLALARRWPWGVALAVFIAASSSSATHATCLSPRGDVNASGNTNISDVQCIQLVALWALAGGFDALPLCTLGDPTRADADCSGAITVADVQVAIQYAIGQPLSSALDSNGNGCPDACDVPVAGCGDGTCGVGESCTTCSTDCGVCTGACCSPEPAPGCADLACQDCVCAFDDFCCEASWDFICATEATFDCPQHCGCPGPSEGACCTDWVVPGCANSACEQCVCQADGFCCDAVWDESCVGLATDSCNASCSCAPDNQGDCCASHEAPGCQSSTCEDCVCSVDSFCCETMWDELCVGAAATMCNDACECVAGTGCCLPHASPGCDAQMCEMVVCTADPFCCEQSWDAACASLATSSCGPDCTFPAFCPGTGSCCADNGSAGCSNTACCETVCGTDPYCCEVTWDALCASAAHSMCAALCQAPTSCPFQGGDCCTADGTPGCDDVACCELVCEGDPYCCSVGWDSTCASAAATSCTTIDCTPEPACPSAGSCMEAHAGTGCSDAACCLTVCAMDSFCCEATWDAICAGEAQDVCVTVPTGCPGPGDCVAEHGTPGCADTSCCSMVCDADPYCCDTMWDAVCASEAMVLCMAPPPVCPGGGGACCTSNGSPGCEDIPCCLSVCADDPYCCDVTWDSACGDAALSSCPTLCGAPAQCPGDGDCCSANGSPGCMDTACCEAICAADSFCCATGWDDLCASAAQSTCSTCVTAGDSCLGHCDEQAPDGCWCDEMCVANGDCCADACSACGYCP